MRSVQELAKPPSLGASLILSVRQYRDFLTVDDFYVRDARGFRSCRANNWFHCFPGVLHGLSGSRPFSSFVKRNACRRRSAPCPIEGVGHWGVDCIHLNVLILLCLSVVRRGGVLRIGRHRISIRIHAVDLRRKNLLMCTLELAH